MQAYLTVRTGPDNTKPIYELNLRQGTNRLVLPLYVRTEAEAEAIRFDVARAICLKTMETCCVA